jgi:lipid A 3-O-deacylase
VRPARRMHGTGAACAALVVASCGTVSVYDENDLWSPRGHSDSYYTHGTRLSLMFPVAAPDGDEPPPPVRRAGAALVRRAAQRLPLYDAGETTQYGLVLGQDIYTPADISRRRLDPDDRPYAGWAYVGVLVANAERRAGEEPAGDHVQTLELDLGVVGPRSHAQDTQEYVHRVVGSDRPRGWHHQLRSEVGAVATYEARRRLLAAGGSEGTGCDLLGTAGASAGNVLVEGRAGLTARVGWNLPRDFGVNTIHTTAVEVPDVRDTCSFRAYVFGGGDGHAVAHTIFLDGNTFRRSHSVDREPFTAELRAGLALGYAGVRFAYTFVHRTREFDGQPSAQQFGSLSLTYTVEF